MPDQEQQTAGIIKKETGIAIGLVVALLLATVWIVNAVNNGATETKLLRRDMNAFISAVNLRVDNIQTEINARTEDRLYRTDFAEWATRLQLLNPDVSVPDPRDIRHNLYSPRDP